MSGLVTAVPVDTTHRAWLPWLVCLSAGLFLAYEFFQLNLFDVINHSLQTAFHATPAALSWMSSAYIWANVLFLLPAGILLDKYSTRLITLLAMATCVLGSLGFALAHSFAWAVFFHALTGAGNAFCFLSCVVLVSRWFPPHRQAFVVGCLVTLLFIGGMIAHTPLAYLNAKYGWRAALLIDAIVGFFILFWMYYFVRDNPSAKSHVVPADIWLNRFTQALLNKDNWLAGFYTACLNLPIIVFGALWGVSYLKHTHHVSAMAASNMVSFIFVGSIIGCPLFGWLSDKHGRRKPTMIIGAIATGVALMPLLIGTHLSSFVVSSLLFLIGFFSSVQVISYALITESNNPCNTGVANGLASILIMAFGGFAQVLFGVLLEWRTKNLSHTGPDFQFAMYIFPIATILALFAVVCIRETYCKQRGIHATD